MNVIGIVFSNIYDSSLGDLTEHRTSASLPFGGRYRHIDFVLSNMVNSDITTIGVITKHNYQSLMDHLGSCSEWDLNRKDSGLFILPPFNLGQSGVYRGKLEALSGASTFLHRGKPEYVLLSDSNLLCNIDYQKVLKAHKKSGAKVTVIANRQKPAYDGETMPLVLQADQNSKANDVLIDTTYDEQSLIGMGMYIVEKQYLISSVKECVARGHFHFERDLLQAAFNEGTLDINIYEFNGTVLRNKDVASYFKNNMACLDENVRNDLFSPENPIYTKVRDEAPTFYSEKSVTNDCLIADGCIIKGNVDNSVIFRDVTIEEGAVVKNSIIMQGSVVSKNARVEYSIIDKNVVITEGTTLIGAQIKPEIIPKGKIV